MAVKRSGYKRSVKRKPFWEGVMEWSLGLGKKLILPALLIWLIGWLWLGGLFDKGMDFAWQGIVNWTAGQGLQVDDVVIEGRYRTDINDLQNAINIDRGIPLLSVDVDGLQARIEALSWVKTATVGRHYNGIISVTMIEHVPFVVWERPGRGKALVDTEGIVIEGANIDEYSSLLVVSGIDAPKHTVFLMQTIMAEPNVAEYIKGAEWIGDRRWDLITKTGTRINLPENDIGYAMTRLAKLQQEKNIMDRGLLSIDLRAQDRIIIETQRGEARDATSLSNLKNSI